MEFREVYGYKVSKCGVVLGKRGKPLKPSDNGKGYLILTLLLNDGGRLTKAVHRLVAEAWIPNPENLPEVNHKDCNRQNNHADNLEWVTHGENIEYSYTTEGRSATGTNNARCKTTEDDVHGICHLLVFGHSAAYIRDQGYDYGVVRAIKARKNWTHISEHYHW